MPKYTSNDDAIITALGFLAMLFPRFQLSEETIAAYVRILGDLPADLIEQAAEDIGSRNTFFPAASEIRTAAFELVGKQHGLPTAYEAWGEVVRLAGSVGYTGKPEFSHPLIKETVESVGGWRMLCLSENQVADRARFVASFDTFVSREKYEIRTLPGVRKFTEQIDSGKVQTEVKKLAAKMKSKSDGRYDVGELDY
jgi:hypothetical protein